MFKLTMPNIGLFSRKSGADIGIEIGSDSSRVVTLSKATDANLKHTLEGFGTIESALDESSSSMKYFGDSLNKIGRGRRRLAISVNDTSIRIRRMVLPRMPDGDTVEAIRWNFREHVDIPMEEYTVGYIPLNYKVDGNKVAVLAYGISKKVLNYYTRLFLTIGYNVVSVEPVPSAMLASLSLNGKLIDDACCVSLYFSYSLSNFAVFRGEDLLFSRPLHVSDYTEIVRAIASASELDASSSKSALRAWMGLSNADSLPETEDIKAVINKFYSNMVIEVQRSIDAFCVLYGMEKMECIYLCGLGALYPDLDSYMNKTLGVRTEIFNPFDGINVGEDGEKVISERNSFLYPVAMGLAAS